MGVWECDQPAAAATSLGASCSATTRNGVRLHGKSSTTVSVNLPLEIMKVIASTTCFHVHSTDPFLYQSHTQHKSTFILILMYNEKFIVAVHVHPQQMS